MFFVPTIEVIWTQATDTTPTFVFDVCLGGGKFYRFDMLMGTTIATWRLDRYRCPWYRVSSLWWEEAA